MKRLVLLLFLLLAFPVMASHIVGGEFELIYNPATGNYKLNLILYFDKLNGQIGAKDGSVTVRIFRKKDHAVMQDITLFLTNESAVAYSQPECSDGSIETDRLVYTRSGELVLSPTQYNDPGGYYIAWERCCRNYNITNIFSQDPNAGGIYAGQTFYLEFPAVTRNGEPFINSSPKLFQPLRDYGCVNRVYYADFTGTDTDGDSLVYSIADPLNTVTGDALPTSGFPHHGPYPSVNWRSPFSSTNIMGGNPDLKISTDGLLTVTPKLVGLYVFAVKCEEFRDGEKIGEVRRDFQMLVLSDCPQGDAPKIEAKSTPAGTYQANNLNVNYTNTTNDDDRCIQVRVSDPDASQLEDNFTEKIKLKIIPLGFKKNLAGLLPTISSATLINGSTVEFDICFPQCPYVDGPYRIGIISYDDACPQPLSDTIVVTVNVQPPGNARPKFTPDLVVQTVEEGTPIPAWKIIGVDTDLDDLTIIPIAPLFDFAAYGFSYQPVSTVPGRIEGSLTWNNRCDEIDFSLQRDFEFRFLLNDNDLCNLQPADTMVFHLGIELEENSPPQISASIDPGRRYIFTDRKIFESLNFNITGTDGDGDELKLVMNGIGFDPAPMNVSFNNATGTGTVTAPFQWGIPCPEQSLTEKDTYTFEFIVIDEANKCLIYQADSVNVTVKLNPPDNEKPILSITNLLPAVPFDARTNAVAMTLGQQLSLQLEGRDTDNTPMKDQLRLELIKAEGTVAPPTGYVFENATGLGTVASPFGWKPECSIFQNGIFENEYTFAFRVTDGRCYSLKGDTVQMTVVIKDLESKASEFIPPNIITPNGDDKNEFFAMLKENPDTQQLESILPLDNCVGKFLNIRIFNRWGKEVFISADRDFRWTAPQAPAGVYFYYLKYSDKEYKGTVTVQF